MHYFDLFVPSSLQVSEMSTVKSLTEVTLLKHMNKVFSNPRT
jgi:hypothetical protein